MSRISVRWEPSCEGGGNSFTLEELGVESMEEWGTLSQEEQRQRIQEAFDAIPEVVYPVAVSWDVKD